jgi:hypothetical protein
MVLLILAVIWAAVLVPPWFQNRRENRPSDSIANFRQQLSVLERTTPGYEPRAAMYSRPAGSQITALHAHRAAGVRAAASRAAHRRAETRKRRRDLFVTLLVAAGTTLGLAFVLGNPAVWVLNVVIDIALVAYVALLAQMAQRGAERTAKVRYLPRSARSPEAALMLRRSGT